MSTLSEYQTAALRALAIATQTARLRQDLRDRLLYGVYPSLPAEILATGGDITIPDVPELESVGGMPRAYLTPAAVERHEARILDRFQQQVYLRLQVEVDNGNLPKDVAISVLTELNLPVPAENTHVEADVKGVGRVVFTLPGDVGVEDVRAKLDAVATDPAGDAVKAAFEGVDVVLKPKVTALYVNPQSDWPAWSDR